MSVVLDSSAVLALLWLERGHPEVASILGGSLLSAVNFAETLAKISDRGIDGPDTRLRLMQLPVTIFPFNSRQAELSGALRPLTRRRGLSLGDRACLALAMAERAAVVTADRTWLDLGLDIEIRCIR